MMLRDPLRFVVAVFAFASAFFLSEIAVRSVSPLWLATSRCVFGTLSLWVIGGLRRESEAVPLWAGALGLIQFTIPYALVGAAAHRSDGASVGYVFALLPVAGALLGHRERWSPTRVAGLGIALLGALALQVANKDVPVWGPTVWLSGTAVLCYVAASATLVRVMPLRGSSLAWTLRMLSGGALGGSLLAVWLEPRPTPEAWIEAWVPLAMLGIVCTGLGFWARTALLKSRGLVTTSLISYWIPVAVALISLAAYRSMPPLGVWMASALVGIGSVFVWRAGRLRSSG